MMRPFLVIIFLSLAAPILGQNEGKSILEKHFSNTGQELWNQINTITVDGRWVDENYYGRAIKLTFKAPDKVRIQGKYDKQTFIEAYNGLYGWIVAPWKNKYEPQRMNAGEELIIRNSFSLGSPLYSYKDQLSFKGHEYVEGEVYNAFVYEDDRVKKTFYLGQDDHKLYYEKLHAKADGAEILKVYEKYRSYNGLSLPVAVRFEGVDLEKELVFDEVFLGLGAKDAMFDAPDGK